MQTTKLQQPTRLDQVCWQVFNSLAPLQQMLQLNPNLLHQPVLPAGIVVLLPQLKPATTRTNNQWNL